MHKEGLDYQESEAPLLQPDRSAALPSASGPPAPAFGRSRLHSVQPSPALHSASGPAPSFAEAPAVPTAGVGPGPRDSQLPGDGARLGPGQASHSQGTDEGSQRASPDGHSSQALPSGGRHGDAGLPPLPPEPPPAAVAAAAPAVSGSWGVHGDSPGLPHAGGRASAPDESGAGSAALHSSTSPAGALAATVRASEPLTPPESRLPPLTSRGSTEGSHGVATGSQALARGSRRGSGDGGHGDRLGSLLAWLRPDRAAGGGAAALGAPAAEGEAGRGASAGAGAAGAADALTEEPGAPLLMQLAPARTPPRAADPPPPPAFGRARLASMQAGPPAAGGGALRAATGTPSTSSTRSSSLLSAGAPAAAGGSLEVPAQASSALRQWIASGAARSRGGAPGGQALSDESRPGSLESVESQALAAGSRLRSLGEYAALARSSGAPSARGAPEADARAGPGAGAGAPPPPGAGVKPVDSSGSLVLDILAEAGLNEPTGFLGAGGGSNPSMGSGSLGALPTQRAQEGWLAYRAPLRSQVPPLAPEAFEVGQPTLEAPARPRGGPHWAAGGPASSTDPARPPPPLVPPSQVTCCLRCGVGACEAVYMLHSAVGAAPCCAQLCAAGTLLPAAAGSMSRTCGGTPCSRQQARLTQGANAAYSAAAGGANEAPAMSSQLGGQWARTPGPASYQQLPRVEQRSSSQSRTAGITGAALVWEPSVQAQACGL